MDLLKTDKHSPIVPAAVLVVLLLFPSPPHYEFYSERRENLDGAINKPVKPTLIPLNCTLSLFHSNVLFTCYELSDNYCVNHHRKLTLLLTI